MPRETLPLNPHREQMIARAERRRGLLERLSAVGMKAAERLAHRTWAPEVGDEAARNGLAFAKVSLAVRLTIMLEAKIDEEILALSNGVTPTRAVWLESAVRPERVDRAPERDAIEHRRVEDESLDEREFDRLPSGGFKGCIAAICDDLDIEPDWSCWTDEEGFVHDDGSPVTEFRIREVMETPPEQPAPPVPRRPPPR